MWSMLLALVHDCTTPMMVVKVVVHDVVGYGGGQGNGHGTGARNDSQFAQLLLAYIVVIVLEQTEKHTISLANSLRDPVIWPAADGSIILLFSHHNDGMNARRPALLTGTRNRLISNSA